MENHLLIILVTPLLLELYYILSPHFAYCGSFILNLFCGVVEGYSPFKNISLI